VRPGFFVDPPADRRVWNDVSPEDWNDWRWQQRERIHRMEQLEKVIDVTDEERQAFVKSDAIFHLGITPYYALLIDRADPNCPIRLQSVPKMGELTVMPEDLVDPLGEEKDMPVPGITHRYPDRVLFYLTANCPVYCRHCTRKRKVSDPRSAVEVVRQLDQGIDYIRKHDEIRDVVLSGGDPLTFSDDRLEDIIGELRTISHLEIIRLGTRNPVTLPQRITTELCEMLKKYQPIYVHTHFNHTKECTTEAAVALNRLADAGCVLGNQMVLLKGVNDDWRVVKEMNLWMLKQRCRPYYIYQCDMAEGIAHFRTSLDKGIEIIDHLRGWTSGMAVPHLVIDAPGGGGKVPVLPEYILWREEHTVRLRNYKGEKYTYVDGADPEPK